MIEVDAGYPIRYAEALPDRLARLGRRFEMVWATSWEDDANEFLAPIFGLPDLPVLRFKRDLLDDHDLAADPESPEEPATWKLATIARFVRDRPFAWVDDEIGADAHEWGQQRPYPTLLLDVGPTVGLTEEDVATLIAFADQPAGRHEGGGPCPAIPLASR